MIESVLENCIPPEWVSLKAPPLEVDFGCHRGTFLVGMAQLYPDRNFLGIERQIGRVQRCLEKIQRLDLPNALVVQGEGAESLRRWLPDACVSIFHISFPDPWPKRRHAHRRLVNLEFLDEVKRVLRLPGILRLMTDDEDYFRYMRRATAAEWEELPWNDGQETVNTSFERKFADLGRTTFRSALRLRSAPAQDGAL